MKQSPRPMRLIQCVFPLLFACSAFAAAQTDTAPTRTITLDEAVQLALEHNLDIQIERYNPLIAEFTLAGSYSVYEPGFNFSAEHTFNTSPGGRDAQGLELPSTEVESDNFNAAVGPGLSGYLPTGLRYQLSGNLSRREFSTSGTEQFSSTAGISLQQPLLRDFWIDQPRAQILINKKNLEISEWALIDRIMQTVTAVEQAYYNLIFTRENVRVQTNALELANQLLRENRERVRVGALAPLDEKQAEAQVASIQAQVIEALRAVDAQENLLKNLITDDYAAWHNISLEPAEALVSVPIEFDLPESWRKGLTQRPDLQQLRVDLERRDITLKFQKNQLFPALDLVGSYGHNALNTSYGSALDDLTEGNNPRYSYGIVLSVPLGNINARNRYKIAKAEKQQALLVYKRLEQQIMVEIDDAIKLARSAFQRVQATREARLFAEAALEAEQKKLASGKSTSFLVLQFQRDLTAAQFEEIRALAEYNIALAQLALREGTTLERRGLTLKVKP